MCWRHQLKLTSVCDEHLVAGQVWLLVSVNVVNAEHFVRYSQFSSACKLISLIRYWAVSWTTVSVHFPGKASYHGNRLQHVASHNCNVSEWFSSRLLFVFVYSLACLFYLISLAKERAVHSDKPKQYLHRGCWTDGFGSWRCLSP